MIEEVEIPIHGITRIIGYPIEQPAKIEGSADSTETTVQVPVELDSSPDPIVEAIKLLIQNSSENSAWRNITWLDIDAQVAHDYKELFDLIAGKAYHTLSIRKAFNKFYENDIPITIPLQKRSDLKYYKSLYNTVNCENDGELVLCLALEHVARLSTESFTGGNDSIQLMDNYLDAKLQSLEISRSSEFGIEIPRFNP
jgi:hypothetical protein